MLCAVALLVALDIVVRAGRPVTEAHAVVGGDPSGPAGALDRGVDWWPWAARSSAST